MRRTNQPSKGSSRQISYLIEIMNTDLRSRTLYFAIQNLKSVAFYTWPRFAQISLSHYTLYLLQCEYVYVSFLVVLYSCSERTRCFVTTEYFRICFSALELQKSKRICVKKRVVSHPYTIFWRNNNFGIVRYYIWIYPDALWILMGISKQIYHFQRFFLKIGHKITCQRNF